MFPWPRLSRQAAVLLLLVTMLSMVPFRPAARADDDPSPAAETLEISTATSTPTEPPTATSTETVPTTTPTPTAIGAPTETTQPIETSEPAREPTSAPVDVPVDRPTEMPIGLPESSSAVSASPEARPTWTPTPTPVATRGGVGAQVTSTQAARRSTRTYAPVADARVEQQRPTSRLGGSTSLRTAKRARSSASVYLLFDVTGVAGSVVDARLRLYVIDGTNDAPTVSGAASGWSETRITWRSQPVRTTGVVDDRGAVGAGRWLSFNVTALVDGNGRVTFLLTGGSNDAITFSARESARNRPQLVLTIGAASERPQRIPPPAPTVSPTTTPAPTSVPTAIATAAEASGGEPASLRWGVIGIDQSRMEEIHDAGIGVAVVKVSWRALEPAQGVIDAGFVQRKRAEVARLRGVGFAVVVDLGLQDAPAWVHTTYADSRYVNQYGRAYTGDGNIDAGDANLVFNRELRAAAGWYVDQLFANLGTDFYGVRFGGGRYGELTYPPHDFAGDANSYWGFDADALASNPAPGWRPGEPSPNGEAGLFSNWYLNALVDFQTWQISAIRRSYTGPLMALYPSWGLRPGQLEQAVAGDLAGRTAAEINGEVQRGYDFARQVAAITDAGVVPTTTWLDAPERFAGPGNPTPVAYLAALAAAHPLRLRVYGENTGGGGPAELAYCAAQATRYGLIGMVWFREEQLFSGGYASLQDYRRVIVSYRG